MEGGPMQYMRAHNAARTVQTPHGYEFELPNTSRHFSLQVTQPSHTPLTLASVFSDASWTYPVGDLVVPS